jgi:hypothetical protein
MSDLVQNGKRASSTYGTKTKDRNLWQKSAEKNMRKGSSQSVDGVRFKKVKKSG